MKIFTISIGQTTANGAMICICIFIFMIKKNAKCRSEISEIKVLKVFIQIYEFL